MFCYGIYSTHMLCYVVMVVIANLYRNNEDRYFLIFCVTFKFHYSFFD